MGVITLNSEEIIKLGTSALNAIHDEQAESDLAKLIEIKDSIDNFLDTVKKQILKEVMEQNPNVTAYQGKLLKMEFRKYGSKYAIKKGLDTLAVDNGFAKAKTTISLDTKAIDDYVENSGVLPEYIEEKNRPTTLTIKKI